MTTRRVVLTSLFLIAVWFAYSIAFWGLPVAFRYHITQQFDTNADGKIDTWEIEDRTAKTGTFAVEKDTDFDGTVDQIEFNNPKQGRSKLSSEKNHRSVTICLDGVPYTDMQLLWQQGYFREFGKPGKLISVFPSLSDIAITEALHTAKVPGYENLFFDLTSNRISGGAASTLSKAKIPYLDALDYDEPGIFKGLAYVLPLKTYHADLGRLLKRWAASNKTAYQAHICSSDAICHVVGPEEFRTHLLQIDQLLREILIQAEGNIDITVFSDHGNSHVASRRIDLEGFLAKNGFHLGSSLDGDQAVVAPAFGLVGAIALYSRPQNTQRLAELLSQMEGVDFATYANGNSVLVVSKGGRARINNRHNEDRLEYEMMSGDPLNLRQTIAKMSQQGILDSESSADGDAWFRATAEHEYPDGVNALYRGVTNHVKNPASLLLSLKDEYHYGSRFFGRLVTLRSTHGSLVRSSMTGFYMSNKPKDGSTLPSRNLLGKS